MSHLSTPFVSRAAYVRWKAGGGRVADHTLGRNSCFQVGDFVGAEKFYTQAIAKDPTCVFAFLPLRSSLTDRCTWGARLTRAHLHI